MNKRIKELAIEAGMIVGDANGFDMTKLLPREVRFAELIVRECLSYAKDGDIDFMKFMIKQNFGIEE